MVGSPQPARSTGGRRRSHQSLGARGRDRPGCRGLPDARGRRVGRDRSVPGQRHRLRRHLGGPGADGPRSRRDVRPHPGRTGPAGSCGAHRGCSRPGAVRLREGPAHGRPGRPDTDRGRWAYGPGGEPARPSPGRDPAPGPAGQHRGFIRVLAAVADADEPVRIDPRAIRWKGAGPDRQATVDDIEHWLAEAVATSRTFAGLGVPGRTANEIASSSRPRSAGSKWRAT